MGEEEGKGGVGLGLKEARREGVLLEGRGRARMANAGKEEAIERRGDVTTCRAPSPLNVAVPRLTLSVVVLMFAPNDVYGPSM